MLTPTIPLHSHSKKISKHDKLNHLLTGFDNDKFTDLLLKDQESKTEYADDAPIIEKERGTILIKDRILIKNKPLKREIWLSKNRLLSKNGYLKHKNKDKIKLCNSILMSELMIDISKEKQVEESQNDNLNNNDTVTNNKNNRKSSKDREKSDEKKRKTLKDSDINKNSALNHSKRKKGTDDNNKNEQNKVRKKKLEKPKSKISLDPVTEKRLNITKKKLYICDICCRQFDVKTSMIRHMYTHMYHKKFPCDQCNRVYRKALYLQYHIVRDHPDWDQHYMCNLCSKSFILKENLAIHMATHNSDDTMFKCLYCKQKFAQQIEVIEHEKKHLVNGEYKCTLCERVYPNRNKLSLHMKVHLKLKEYVCQHCGRGFIRINSLKRHVQIFHERFRIQCKICKKSLKGHLSDHMRTHKNDRPYKCQDCGLSFAQSTQLTVHRRYHTGVRPYTCRICKRPFTHSTGLMLHIRIHTGEKPFECFMCPLAFSQLPHMKAHLRTIHNQENPYRCECKECFKFKKDLEDHTKICSVATKEASLLRGNEAAVKLSRLRFLLALLLTMIASKDKLKYLGFNKRLIDDLLVESLEAMGYVPCKKKSLTPLNRLLNNIGKLLKGTVPKEKMKKFEKQGRSTEEILELLTDQKN